MTTMTEVEPGLATGNGLGAPAASLVAATKLYRSSAGSVTALDSIDVEFEAGAFTAIMGPSGSGKSTLMHCLAGLDRLTEGHAFLGRTNLSALSERDLTLLRRAKVGFIFQAYNLVPSLSARENITLPLALSNIEPDVEVLDHVVEMLDISDRLDHRPSELSGGEQQRVAVARALVAEPEVVFADEPTGNLDSRAGAEILSFLREAANERQQTVVMVTHDPSAAAWADRVVFLVDGGVHEDIAAPGASDIHEVMKQLGR